jgi:hypothetical protein
MRASYPATLAATLKELKNYFWLSNCPYTYSKNLQKKGLINNLINS